MHTKENWFLFCLAVYIMYECGVRQEVKRRHSETRVSWCLKKYLYKMMILAQLLVQCAVHLNNLIATKLK